MLSVACAPKAPYSNPEPLPPRIVVARVELPDDFRSCPAAPRPPAAGAKQSDVARYIVRLYEARRICAARLDGIVRIVDQNNITAAELERAREAEIAERVGKP